jgi:hypothetical protein
MNTNSIYFNDTKDPCFNVVNKKMKKVTVHVV